VHTGCLCQGLFSPLERFANPLMPASGRLNANSPSFPHTEWVDSQASCGAGALASAARSDGKTFHPRSHPMSDSTTTDERRSQLQLRALFPAACEALRPFFDPANRLAGQSLEHSALVSLQDKFPGLSAEEYLVVLASAKRFFAAGRFPPVP
jgi:hypothetical protein